MIHRFSNNIAVQFIGIFWNSKWGITVYSVISTLAVVQYQLHLKYDFWMPHVPIFPVTILGGALAIFLGFRNNSAYDRWWEARKIWGAIVNYSRTLSMYLNSFASTVHSNGSPGVEEMEEWKKSIAKRHIAWLYTLMGQLRQTDYSSERDPYLDKKEISNLESKSNKAVQLLNNQGTELKHGFEAGYIDHFRHLELARLMKDFYSEQGKAERIKKTIFPFYYNYFTRVFLWIFIVLFPITIVEDMLWGTIPISIAISFVFFILEKSGAVTEDPFEGRAADTPMANIVRTIEIDMLEMINEDQKPEPLPQKVAKFGVLYSD